VITNKNEPYSGADVSEEGNQETCRKIEELGGRALAVRCDVSRAGDVKAALDKALDVFGRLDFTFNNAGVEQPITATSEITEEEWNRNIRINLSGVFLCMKYEIPLMAASEHSQTTVSRKVCLKGSALGEHFKPGARKSRRVSI
jgi:NAD(P)-dependent dehydrogenase (short-subunit alcohol dehydrogenase family)